MPNLSHSDVAGYGRVWSTGSGRSLRRLADDVDEYFALGLDVPAGGLVVDVGANIGMFAIAAARRAAELRLVAVEPIQRLHDALERNLGENRHLARLGPRTRLVRAGLGRDEAETEVEFAYFERFPTDSTRYLEGKRREFERLFEQRGHALSRSIQRRLSGRFGRLAGAALGSVVASLPRGRLGRWMSDELTGLKRVKCPMTTLARVLDYHVRPVDVLKIDVEGAEIDVILGARPNQWSLVRQVVLQGSDLDGGLARVCGLLAERGLTMQVVTEPLSSAERGLRSFLLLATRDGDQPSRSSRTALRGHETEAPACG